MSNISYSPPSHRHSPARLQDTLERVRICSGWEGPLRSRQWLDVLGVTRRQYRLFLDGRRPLGDAPLAALCSMLGLDESELLNGTVDFKRVAIERERDRKSELPSTYRNAAFGRMRTTIHSFDFLERVDTWRLRHEAMRKLGIRERSLTDPNAPVSIQLITDLTRYLVRSQGFIDDEFREMGAFAFRSNLSTPIAQAFSHCSGIGKVYEKLTVDLIRHFENNCTYHLMNLTRDGCRLVLRENRDAVDAMGGKHLGSAEICQLKAGFFAAAGEVAGARPSEVIHTECVHEGESHCTFEIRFDHRAPSPGFSKLRRSA